jgi:hypothetical protein
MENPYLKQKIHAFNFSNKKNKNASSPSAPAIAYSSFYKIFLCLFNPLKEVKLNFSTCSQSITTSKFDPH